MMGAGGVAGDQDLVARHRAGDEQAFAELYRQHYPALVRYAQQRFGNEHLAEEVAQETMVRAYSCLHRLGHPYKIQAWLRGIATHVATDLHRSSSRALSTAQVDPGQESSAEGEWLRQLDRANVRTALARVGGRHHEVLVLQNWDELSYEQIAGHTHVSVSTVQPLLQRAKQALRREYLAIAGPPDTLGIAPLLGGLVALLRRARDRVGQTLHGLPDLSAPIAGVMVSVTSVVSPLLLAPAGPEAGLGAEILASDSTAEAEGVPASPITLEGQPAVQTPPLHPIPAGQSAIADTPDAKASKVALGGSEVVTDGPGDPEWEDERDRMREMPIYVGHGDWGVGIDPGTPEGTLGYLEETVEETASGDGGLWDGVPADVELYPEEALPDEDN